MHICKRLDTCLVRLRAWWLFGVICLSISTRFHDVKERARRCFVAYAVQRLLKLCTGVIFDVMSRDIASIPRDTTQVKRLDHACSPIDTHLAPMMQLQIIQSVAPFFRNFRKQLHQARFHCPAAEKNISSEQFPLRRIGCQKGMEKRPGSTLENCDTN